LRAICQFAQFAEFLVQFRSRAGAICKFLSQTYALKIVQVMTGRWFSTQNRPTRYTRIY